MTKTLVVPFRYEIDESLWVYGQALKHLAWIVSDRTAGIYSVQARQASQFKKNQHEPN